MVIAVGNPQARELLAERAAAYGFTFASYIHPSVQRSPHVTIGDGALVFAASVLTTEIRLGHHVHINVGCTVSHDAIIGDYATLAPGSHLSGWVELGRRVSIGTGASVRDGTPGKRLLIEDDAIVGVGACVIRPVAAGTTVVGVPARPLVR